MANLAYIQVTRKCNQTCRFCSNPPTSKHQSVSFFKQLMDYYKQKKYVGVILTGGEPTLYPYLHELIEYANKKKLQLRVMTNGQIISDLNYLKSLHAAGLRHVGLSLYSNNSKIQAFLTKNPTSLYHIKKALGNLEKCNIKTDIITVINKYNADHLSGIVQWIVSNYPFVRHFVWNNLDPLMNRASRHKDTIPKLRDIELELFKAMSYLTDQQRTFRVERLPLCYMADFAFCSTETRKIIKGEERTVYFLDHKKLVRQNKWSYGKTRSEEHTSELQSPY